MSVWIGECFRILAVGNILLTSIHWMHERFTCYSILSVHVPFTSLIFCEIRVQTLANSANMAPRLIPVMICHCTILIIKTPQVAITTVFPIKEVPAHFLVHRNLIKFFMDTRHIPLDWQIQNHGGHFYHYWWHLFEKLGTYALLPCSGSRMDTSL